MHARRRKDVSQSEMSEELGFSGNSVITKIESGNRDVLLVEFIHICEFLGENPNDVFRDFVRQIEGMPRTTIRDMKRHQRRD